MTFMEGIHSSILPRTGQLGSTISRFLVGTGYFSAAFFARSRRDRSVRFTDSESLKTRATSGSKKTTFVPFL